VTDLGLLQNAAWQISEDHGFHENQVSIDRRLMLIIGEVSEAHEELRTGHDVDEIYYKDGKPEGVPIELADTVIRIFDFCEHYGIDLEECIQIKMGYNKTREHMHGKAF
jgi:NTP pyrophosphatase (non-canonical NTP hydrolase)